jgi:hypothetical protein
MEMFTGQKIFRGGGGERQCINVNLFSRKFIRKERYGSFSLGGTRLIFYFLCSDEADL